MRIAVCDDEKEIRNMVARSIRMLYPSWEILEYETGEELLKEAESFQIILLDIQMEGLNGMETARLIRQKDRRAVLIFLTALEEYVFQAFDVEAFHYLVKPFEKAEFYRILDKAAKRAEEYRGYDGEAQGEQKSIAVKTGTVTRKVYQKQILYGEVYNRKVQLHLKENETIEFYGRLSELEQTLGSDFVRVHRAYLVHMRYISSYQSQSITMENGDTVMMAKQKYKEFVQQYLRYMKRMEEESE